MRILIHTMNNSLFPDADPGSTTWTGPPREITIVQSLLYASLTTSLFAAFLAMLGKQWVNRYLRIRGGSAADKSRDRQRKFDGFEKWHFHLAIESLPVMLQLALLLLGCALSRYLWTTSRPVAGVIAAVTIFGVTLYVFLTLAAIISYNCPYQTPPSIFARALIRYLARSDNTFTRSLPSPVASVPSVKEVKRTLRSLRTGICRALKSSGCIPGTPEEADHIRLAIVPSPDASLPRFSQTIPINWDVHRADIRCVSWILSSTTDTDVIYSTTRFAADAIWYPEVAGVLSPHVLANLFFDCLPGGWVVPGKAEYAGSIGMALASTLSNQLIAEPEDRKLRELCERVDYGVHLLQQPDLDQTLLLVTSVLRFIMEIATDGDSITENFGFMTNIPDRLPTLQKLWLSRIILQTLWRWRRIQGPTTALKFSAIESICKAFAADRDRNLTILRTNCFLIMAIALGLQIDIYDLYVSNNEYVPLPHFFQRVCSLCGSEALHLAILLFFKHAQISIRKKVDSNILISVLSASNHLDPMEGTRNELHGFDCLAGISNSGYPDGERYTMANVVIQLLGKNPSKMLPSSCILPLLDFLSLSEKLCSAEGLTALRILSTGRRHANSGARIIPVLTSILLPTHLLQSRVFALKIFCGFAPAWFSSQMENILRRDLGGFLQAVGDPFQFPDHSIPDGQSVGMANYKPMEAAVILIEFTSSDLWRNYLHRSNFSSCEETLSTEEGKRTALSHMFDTAIHSWSEFLCTPAKVIAAIKRLEDLQCPNITETVLLWAWTVDVMDVGDHGAWGLIELDFYRTHGMWRLSTLSRHITRTTTEILHLNFLLTHYGGEPCRVGSVRQSLLFGEVLPFWEGMQRPEGLRHPTALRVAQVCQLRRLYLLFGYDPVTWKDAVAVDEVDGKTDMLSV